MNSIIQGSCHSGPNNPIAAWLEVSHLRGLQRSRSVRTQSLRWNSTWVFCCQRLRGKPFVCIPPHASLFQRLWLVGEWVIRGVAWAYQEHCPVWLLRFAFWSWFFYPVGLCKEAWKVATPFNAVETQTIIWWVTIFPYYCQKSVGYCWICDKFFSVSSLEVVQFQRP